MSKSGLESLKMQASNQGMKTQQELKQPKQFNFTRNWHRFKPFLKDKDVQHALTKAMVHYCFCHNLRRAGFFVKYPKGSSSKKIQNFTKSKNVWPGYGVCCEDKQGAYCTQHGLSWVEGTPLYYYGPCGNEVEGEKEPDSTSIKFYMLWGSCHWIAHFICALAKKVFPKKDWRILKGKEHTIVVDSSNLEDIQVVMDILNFKDQDAAWSLKFTLDGV